MPSMARILSDTIKRKVVKMADAKAYVPSKEGLGMKKVFDDCNQIYGKDFIRYD